MLTVAIPQLYCGASGKKGAYNRQEIGLARAFAARGCRAVALYPAVGAAQPELEEIEPGVQAIHLPARALAVHAFYKSWQPLQALGVQAVHCMGDTSLGVPGLYDFCRQHHIFFYSQLGAVHSDASSALKRTGMELLARRNLAVYRKTPTFAKTPAVARQLAALGVPCAGVMPVGLDTAIIPEIPQDKARLRAELGLAPNARYLLFVGRLDAYKRPLELPAVLAALPADWQAVVIGQGALAARLDGALAAAGVAERCTRIPQLPNEQVQRYYRACDVYLNFNDHEIFGMSLLEAMYGGCPPAARHAPGPDFIVEEGVSGLFANAPAQFAAAAQRLAGDPGFATAARARVREHFLWTAAAEQALDCMRREGGLDLG